MARLDKQHSSTAEGAAAARALAAHERDERIRCPDLMAKKLLRPSYRILASIPGLRALTVSFYERTAPGLYMFHTIRTIHFDKILLGQIESNVEQFVVLGAGLDTRAYRFAEQLKSTKIFEVDHPRTSAWKRQRLKRAFGKVPDAVTYVEVNFQEQNLADRLAESGFDLSKRTFFLWEGVCMYLTLEAIDATLAFVTSTAKGSSVLFEYFYDDVFDDPARYYGGTRLFEYVESKGEKYLSGFDPKTLDTFMEKRGLKVVSNVLAEDFQRDYLDKPDGKTRGQMLDFWAAAHCEVV